MENNLTGIYTNALLLVGKQNEALLIERKYEKISLFS